MTDEVRLAPEQYDSLPGIVEPSENTKLTGHGPVLQRLLVAFHRGRLHHALLLHGPRGIGKATLAFHLARQILGARSGKTDEAPGRRAHSSNAAMNPDGPLFRQIAMGAHPSLLHLTRPLDRDGKKFRTTITVDEVRRIGNLLAHTTHDQATRIVIVDPADDMNTSAANALLKNLEEPPPGTLFLLIAHRPGSLLPTIRSRCHAVRLQPLRDEEVREVLEHSGIAGKTAELAARSGGSPRNAILIAEYGGMEIASTIEEILQSDPLDVEKSHRLGDAVSGRGVEMQFAILNQHILDWIADAARQAGEAGEVERSARLAAFWQETSRQIRNSEALHLDRKQHVFDTLMQLREVLG